MRFLNDIPNILDLVYKMCQNNNICYDDVDDMFNDWIMPYIRELPSDIWISEITHSIEADEVTKAITLDERFKQFLRKD
jgi:hypothetical protein